jgi:hypothetical protein
VKAVVIGRDVEADIAQHGGLVLLDRTALTISIAYVLSTPTPSSPGVLCRS